MCDANRRSESSTPVAVLGSGNLVSHVYRDQQETYAFNVFRRTANFEATHQFGVEDLRDMVKLCQVLAYSMLDDGWVDKQQRELLLELNLKLDEVTQAWSETRHG